MNRLNPSELQLFLRKYRFPGGRLKRLQFRYHRGEVTLLALLAVRNAAGDPVKLKLRLLGIDEHRFQKRPSVPTGKIAEFRLSYLLGKVFLTFDSLGLPPGEMPGIHDYRASEMFAAGSGLLWEEVKSKKSEVGTEAEA